MAEGAFTSVHMNWRFVLAKRPRLGKTVVRLLVSTPNQDARVAKYWSQAVVGIQRPVLTSSGPPTASEGNVPYVWLPCTAPPMMRWWLPQPWSLPTPLEGKVRPKSLHVKDVTRWEKLGSPCMVPIL